MDTIFRAARTLNRALSGRTVTQFETAFQNYRESISTKAFLAARVERVEAQGKWLLMFFSGGSSC